MTLLSSVSQRATTVTVHRPQGTRHGTFEPPRGRQTGRGRCEGARARSSESGQTLWRCSLRRAGSAGSSRAPLHERRPEVGCHAGPGFHHDAPHRLEQRGARRSSSCSLRLRDRGCVRAARVLSGQCVQLVVSRIQGEAAPTGFLDEGCEKRWSSLLRKPRQRI